MTRTLMVIKATLDSGLQIVGVPDGKPQIPKDADYTLATAEREAIELCLDAVNWNIKYASELLGITRCTLYEKLKLYKIGQPSSYTTHRNVQSAQDATPSDHVGVESDVPESERARNSRWRSVLSSYHSGH